jgi:hypothetical protein
MSNFFVFGQVNADSSGASSAWEFGGEIYLWGASINVTSPSGSESQIPFHTLLDDLEMAFMGGLGAQNDKWTVSADLIYMDVKDKLKDDIDLPDDIMLTETGNVEMKAWIVTPTVGYALHNSEKARVEFFGGLRYLWLDAGVKFAINHEPLVHVSDSGSNWDAIVGFRGDISLNEKWFMPLYFDIGAGDSKSTWQGFAGIGYRFNSFDATLAYRYLDYDFDKKSVMDDMVLKGAFAGISFRF